MNSLDVFDSIKNNPDEFSFIDLRSEIEFEGGHFPFFSCHPILSTEERHLVGICYRQQGQAAEIKLGEELTPPVKETRCNHWLAVAKPSQKLVLSCFRGCLKFNKANFKP